MVQVVLAPAGARVLAAAEVLAAALGPVVGLGLAVVAVLAVAARAAEQEQGAAVSLAEPVVLELAVPELVVVEKRLQESGSLHRLSSEVPLSAAAAQTQAHRVPGLEEAAALDSPWRKKMSARCWGSSHNSGSPAKIPKQKWTFRLFSRA
jgi:hypothetical protein